MWKKGTIGSPTEGSVYSYCAKVYDEGSHYGINEGRVSKLAIRKVGETKWLVNYDRGWDIEPATTELKSIVNIILAKYN